MRHIIISLCLVGKLGPRLTMMMAIYCILAAIMILSIGIAYLIQGELGEVNIHLAAYGFILAGIGYIVELLNRREKDLDLKISYMLNKKFVAFSEELKTIRMMLLKLDERRAKLEDRLADEISSFSITTETQAKEKIEYKIPPSQK